MTETIRGLQEELATIKEERRGLREEVEEYKTKAAEEMAKAKDWKMQLDETTCRLITKQDEIDALQQTGRP